MLKLRSAVLLISILCFCRVAAGAASLIPAGAATVTLLLPDRSEVTAELARTAEQQEKGLMFRTELPADRGMLFVFDKSGEKVFWMKNTLISLDIIYLDKNMTVSGIFAEVPASRIFQDDRSVARVFGEARYVLELAAGKAGKSKITVGSAIKIKPPDRAIKKARAGGTVKSAGKN